MSSWPSPQVLGAEDGELASLARSELDDDRRGAAGDFLLDLELLDLEAVHAIGGDDAQTHTLADRDFDARGFKRKATRDDIDLSWCVLTRGTVDRPRGSTDKRHDRGQSYD